jgi:hypothetical protein
MQGERQSKSGAQLAAFTAHCRAIGAYPADTKVANGNIRAPYHLSIIASCGSGHIVDH